MVKINHYLRMKNQLNHLPQQCMKTASNLKVPPGQCRVDVVGPPDPVSNLRPIIFARAKNESKLEERYRESREAVQIWNQEFWTKHNNSFVAERKQFQESQRNAGIESLTADEMSVFYKQFLDKNWRRHLDYNIDWYRKNIGLLLLEIRVRFSKFNFK